MITGVVRNEGCSPTAEKIEGVIRLSHIYASFAFLYSIFINLTLHLFYQHASWIHCTKAIYVQSTM